MRGAALLATTLIVLGAGCVTLPPAATVDGEADPNVIPWTLTRCRYLVGWSPADPAKLQARVPEGFVVPTTNVAGLVPAPIAYLGTEVFECESGSTLDGTLQTMAYGSIFYGVDAPEEYHHENVSLYMIKEHVLVPDAARRELLAARGLTVHDGAIAWESAAGPIGHAARLSLEGYGDFVLSMETAQNVASPDGADEFFEFSPDGAGGIARWHASYAWDEDTYQTGRGTISWPEGSWAADAVGGTRAPGQFHAGLWSFTGTLALPTP